MPEQRLPGGRSMRWRVGMLVGGALVGGYGAALLVWPRILLWTVAGVFIAAGAVLVVSALLARGHGRD